MAFKQVEGETMSDEIIRRLDELGVEMRSGFSDIQKRLATLEGRVDDLVSLQKGTTESIDILVGHLVPRAATGGR